MTVENGADLIDVGAKMGSVGGGLLELLLSDRGRQPSSSDVRHCVFSLQISSSCRRFAYMCLYMRTSVYTLFVSPSGLRDEDTVALVPCTIR